MHEKKLLNGIRKLFNRRLFISLLVLAQLTFFTVMLFRSSQLKWLSSLLELFSVVTALHLLMRPEKSAFKLSLIFLILLFPIFGGAFYWIFHSQTASIGFRARLAKIEKSSQEAFGQNEKAFSDAASAIPRAKKQLQYFKSNTPFPICDATETTYFPDGKPLLDSLLRDLKNAKRYIFLEYFIISDGIMWRSVLEVLTERVRAGVDVRIIYDDLGCFPSLPPHYAKELCALGIQCKKFNPFHPFLTTVQNNRDHRKIAVIDGRIAYTGGINLADEYIGEKQRFGKWKDNAVRLFGDGAWSFTVIFLQTWSFLSKKSEDYDRYRPQKDASPVPLTDGWVQPYADSPMGEENVAEQVYLRIIEQAHRYLYITTPYLMVDDGMISALKSAAKSGVEVRIITPGIPDKKAVHFTTRSYYRTLLRAGVRIYEYSDGFIHAKTFLADDDLATVGTVNLDFRSLYLHFECGTCLYRTSTVEEIRRDLLDTMEHSREITLQDCRSGLLVRFFQSICRIFAPLM